MVDVLPLELLVAVFEQLSSFSDLARVGLVKRRWRDARTLCAQWVFVARNPTCDRYFLAQPARKRLKWTLRTSRLSRGERIRATRWLLGRSGGCDRTDLYYLLVASARRQDTKLLRRLDKLTDVRSLCRLALGLEGRGLTGTTRRWMQAQALNQKM